MDGQRLPPPALQWQHNALRHSFCRYRLPDVKSAAQVAPEAGTRLRMIFEHYRELVIEKAAKALKAKVDKEREEKIMAFPATATA